VTETFLFFLRLRRLSFTGDSERGFLVSRSVGLSMESDERLFVLTAIVKLRLKVLDEGVDIVKL